MFDALLENAKGFVPVWEKFLEEWGEEDELPYYLVLSELARYVAELIGSGNEDELGAIFLAVERWHLEGDSYVKEAATVGFLEDLQNINLVGREIPEVAEKHLLPESRRWWDKVHEFWENGKLISE